MEPFSLIYYSTQTFRPMSVKFVHVTSITFFHCYVLIMIGRINFYYIISNLVH